MLNFVYTMTTENLTTFMVFALFSSANLAMILLLKRKYSYGNYCTSGDGHRHEDDVLETTYSKLIGKTPLIKLKKLSKLLNKNIFVKVM